MVAAALVSCAGPGPTAEERSRRWQAGLDEYTRKSLQTLREIQEKYTAKELTAEEKADVKEKSQAYYEGMVRSIVSLDDKTTDAETIGRAAISANIDKLRAWKRAQMQNLSRISEVTRLQVESGVIGLPSPAQIDEASMMVLTLRKKKARSTRSPDIVLERRHRYLPIYRNT